MTGGLDGIVVLRPSKPRNEVRPWMTSLIYMASRHTSKITWSSLPTAVRYAEGLLSEAAVKRKYRFDDSAWARLGDDDMLVKSYRGRKNTAST